MSEVITLLEMLLIATLAFVLGVFVGERGIGRQAERVRRVLVRPQGAVFKPKGPEEIEAEKDKELSAEAKILRGFRRRRRGV